MRLCTCMLAKEVCGASLILSLSFCCAALSAARSLPGALLSATGLSDELDSASERRQSELLTETQSRERAEQQQHTNLEELQVKSASAGIKHSRLLAK